MIATVQQSISGLRGTMQRKPFVTKTHAEKKWTRRELLRLGSIAGVAGSIGEGTQAGKFARS